MNWIEITDRKNNKHLINVQHIIDVVYLKDTDLTMIEFSRSAFPAIYINGNVVKDVKRAINGTITRVGE